MLNSKPDPIKLLKAYYSEQRNQVCVKNGMNAMIDLRVTTDARIIAATEVKEGQANPHYYSPVMGEVHPHKVRIGNYEAPQGGLIGRVFITGMRDLMQREDIDTMEEFLVTYNMSGENTLKERVESLKAFLGDDLKPEDFIPPSASQATKSAEPETYPLPEFLRKNLIELRKNNKPS